MRKNLKKTTVDSELVSGPELARRLAVTPSTVSRLGADGHVVRAEERGKYLLWASVTEYIEHLRKGATGRASPTAMARAKLLGIQAKRAQFELDKEDGKYCLVSDCENESRKFASWIRNEFLRVPTRIQSSLPHLGREVFVEFNEEIRRILTELAGRYPVDDQREDAGK